MPSSASASDASEGANVRLPSCNATMVMSDWRIADCGSRVLIRRLEITSILDARPRSVVHQPLSRYPMSIIKLLIVACLVGIVISLGSGLFHLVNDKGDSKKMVRALTVRVALSVALFVLLFIAWSQGMIEPHGPAR
jgi:hypothetical protein